MDHAPTAQELAVELQETHLTVAALRAQLEDSAVTRLTDSLLDGFALFDPAAVVLDVNPALCAMTGFEAKELIGTAPPHPCWAPEELGQFLAAIAEVLAGRARPWELHLRRKDDSRLPVLVTPSVLRRDDGEIVSVTLTIKDLSERRRALEALSLSEQRLHTVLDAAHEGIILQARDGTVLTFNKAAGAVFGLQETEVVGKSALGRDWETIHEDGSPWPPDDHPTMRALKSGRPALDLVLGVVREDETRWVVANAYPIMADGEPGPVAAVVSFADQTERLEVERALRDSEERYRLLLQNANDAIILHEHSGGAADALLEVNDSACRLLGYARDELLSMTIGDLVPPDLWPGLPGIAARAEGAGLAVYDAELVRRDGRLIPVEVSTSVFEMQGTHLVLSTIRDVTQRLEADRALREMAATRDLAETVARIGSWRMDLGTGLSVWSPEMFRLFDLDAGDFDGTMTPIAGRVHEDDRHVIRDAVETAVTTGQTSTADLRVIRRDGSISEIHVEGTLELDEAGSPAVLVGYCQDVTEQRAAAAEIQRLNEQLKHRVASRTEQLDAATRELEALAYSIAHDVRAPLRTIDGFSAAVMEDEHERLSPDGVAALQRVRSAAQTLARLLDDLMGLSYVSRRELSLQTVDLTELAAEVGEETAADNPSRPVTLTVAPGLTAEADPGLVRLILRELLGNAWKFTGPVADAHVDVGVLDAGDERAYYVRDDGVGFDMRYAEHLFGIFQRMHPPAQFEGDGVGLATVQRLVRRHGGRTWAESEPGRGTTVYFTLPPGGFPVETATV